MSVDVLSTLSVADLGATGLLALFILALLTGRLVTKSVMGDLRSDRDHWREVAMKSEEARHVQSQQISALTDVGETTQRLVESLHGVVQGGNR